MNLIMQAFEFVGTCELKSDVKTFLCRFSK